MTLVAALVFDGAPVLFADVLLSGVGRPIAETVRPSGARSGGGVNGRRDVDLIQKTLMLGERMILGFSGGDVWVRHVARSLHEQFGSATPTKDQLQAHIRGELADEISHIEMVGFGADGDQVLSLGAQDWPFEVDGIEVGRVIGSGASSLHSAVSLGPILAHKGAESLNATDLAICRALHLSSSFLSDEVATGSSLDQFFGGAYEIIYYDGRAFRRLDDLFQAFLFITEEEGVPVVTAPYLVMKQKYTRSGDLIVRSASYSFKNKTMSQVTNRRYRIQRLTNRAKALSGPPNFGFDSDWRVFHFLKVDGDNKVKGVHTVVDRGDPGNAPMRVSMDGKEVRMKREWFSQQSQ